MIENGTESPSKKGSPVKTQKKRRVTDEDGFAIVPQLSPDESRKVSPYDVKTFRLTFYQYIMCCI